MIKNILTILTIIFITQTSIQAHECHDGFAPKKPTFQEQRKMEAFLNEKLNLTQDQQEQLDKNRSQHRKEMSKVIKKMETQHDKIKEIYMIGIPKYQADIRTAPMKAELVKLKQEADKLRLEYRKSFENTLNEEQKIKFENLKKDMINSKNQTLDINKR